MCLLRVKEEPDYSVPSRVVHNRRVSRHSPSPPRVSRYSRRSIIEERRPSPPPEPRQSTVIRTEERRTSRQTVPAEQPPARSQTHFVEVDHDSSSSSSSDDLRSRTTRKSSRSKPPAAGSEYSMHERETRRERDVSNSAPQRGGEYETYRYVEAPPGRRSGSRGGGPRSYYDGPRASRDSARRERVVTEDEYGRRRREYRR